MGQKLYEIWVAQMHQHVGVPHEGHAPYGTLSQEEQAAWEQLAANLEAEGWGHR